MRGNGRSFRQGRRTFEQENESIEREIHALDLRSCLEHYGVSFNMQGFAYCPFHRERTASFHIRGRFWHCFGCGDSGELIKFVRKKFGLSYSEAITSICEDFGISNSGRTAYGFDRLDRLNLNKYNGSKRYDELLQTLDVCTAMYWLAYDVAEYAAEFHGGKTAENEKYVSAHFALMSAQKALEQAEYDCAQYIKENPDAVPKVAQNAIEAQKCYLPPAPKWG